MPPMWSPWWWVMKSAVGDRSWWRKASMLGAASPGSTRSTGGGPHTPTNNQKKKTQKTKTAWTRTMRHAASADGNGQRRNRAPQKSRNTRHRKQKPFLIIIERDDVH